LEVGVGSLERLESDILPPTHQLSAGILPNPNIGVVS